MPNATGQFNVKSVFNRLLMLAVVSGAVSGEERDAAGRATEGLNLKFMECVRDHKSTLNIAEKFCRLKVIGGAVIIDTVPKGDMGSESYINYMMEVLDNLPISTDLKFFTHYNLDSNTTAQQIVVANPIELVGSDSNRIKYEQFRTKVMYTDILKFHEYVNKDTLQAYLRLKDGFVTKGINAGVEKIEALIYALKQALVQKMKHGHPVDVTKLIGDKEREIIARYVGIKPDPREFFVELALVKGRQVSRATGDNVEYVTFRQVGSLLEQTFNVKEGFKELLGFKQEL